MKNIFKDMSKQTISFVLGGLLLGTTAVGATTYKVVENNREAEAIAIEEANKAMEIKKAEDAKKAEEAKKVEEENKKKESVAKVTNETNNNTNVAPTTETETGGTTTTDKKYETVVVEEEPVVSHEDRPGGINNPFEANQMQWGYDDVTCYFVDTITVISNDKGEAVIKSNTIAYEYYSFNCDIAAGQTLKCKFMKTGDLYKTPGDASNKYMTISIVEVY